MAHSFGTHKARSIKDNESLQRVKQFRSSAQYLQIVTDPGLVLMFVLPKVPATIRWNFFVLETC